MGLWKQLWRQCTGLAAAGDVCLEGQGLQCSNKACKSFCCLAFKFCQHDC